MTLFLIIAHLFIISATLDFIIATLYLVIISHSVTSSHFFLTVTFFICAYICAYTFQNQYHMLHIMFMDALYYVGSHECLSSKSIQ